MGISEDVVSILHVLHLRNLQLELGHELPKAETQRKMEIVKNRKRERKFGSSGARDANVANVANRSSEPAAPRGPPASVSVRNGRNARNLPATTRPRDYDPRRRRHGVRTQTR